ncbi:hypothetical protein ZHAS_00002595 [Anopheles sinensis]|uniref:Uncharacterized protein n=1 Tax=Anopheles sinensis TaxID=74873 RepID=A0A084VCK4_ANOSI|nr:hypothetical protein ZHAS_00002595 [Anopheles sinensis]
MFFSTTDAKTKKRRSHGASSSISLKSFASAARAEAADCAIGSNRPARPVRYVRKGCEAPINSGAKIRCRFSSVRGFVRFVGVHGNGAAAVGAFRKCQVCVNKVIITLPAGNNCPSANFTCLSSRHDTDATDTELIGLIRGVVEAPGAWCSVASLRCLWRCSGVSAPSLVRCHLYQSRPIAVTRVICVDDDHPILPALEIASNIDSTNWLGSILLFRWLFRAARFYHRCWLVP